jgi:hypothetical protein
MAEQKVWVRYLTSELVAANGAQFIEMGLHLALQYKERNLVEIRDLPPDAIVKKSLQLPLPEENNEGMDLIGWVTNEYIDAPARKIARSLGFAVDQFTGSNFDIRRLLKMRLLIVESCLKGYTASQLEDLRFVQFERQKDFIFRVVAFDNTPFFLQNLLHSQCNVFTSQQLFEYTNEVHEDVLNDWAIEERGDLLTLWKRVDAIINPKPDVVVEDNIEGEDEEEPNINEEDADLGDIEWVIPEEPVKKNPVKNFLKKTKGKGK